MSYKELIMYVFAIFLALCFGLYPILKKPREKRVVTLRRSVITALAFSFIVWILGVLIFLESTETALPTVVTFRVLKKGEAEPVKNAAVIFVEPYRYGQKSTDSFGMVNFKIRNDDSQNSLYIRIEHPDYITTTDSLNIELDEENRIYELFLQARATDIVHNSPIAKPDSLKFVVLVSDKINEEPIPNASIIIKSLNGSIYKVGKSDDKGILEINLSHGNIDRIHVTIYKEGYRKQAEVYPMMHTLNIKLAKK